MLFYIKGKSWSHPEKTDLPNNNAGIQANMLSNGKIVVCFNPTNGPRNIMRIAISEDDGKTWPHYKVQLIHPIQVMQKSHTKYLLSYGLKILSKFY